MNTKNVVIVLDSDGVISEVYCPSDIYIVDVLDRSDKNPGESVKKYYEALESILKDLKNCY